MADITQEDRLAAVLSKLERIEQETTLLSYKIKDLSNELRQTKRIIKHYATIQDEPVRGSMVEQTTVLGVKEDGLYPGQRPNIQMHADNETSEEETACVE